MWYIKIDVKNLELMIDVFGDAVETSHWKNGEDEPMFFEKFAEAAAHLTKLSEEIAGAMDVEYGSDIFNVSLTYVEVE